MHKLPHRKIDEATGKPSESEFADDLDKLIGFGEKNKESLGQLLFQFFRVYGYEMDYEKMVISVREGRLLTREEKMWHLAGLKKEARHRLCVEEPFNTDRNLGNSADDFAWRGIHLELRRAFDLLADNGQLDKACEQYEFPSEEKTVFKKPTPTVKTVLQNPTIRSSRGGLGHRGGRGGGFNQKNNYNSQRRASSGASFNTNRGPFMNNAMPGMDYIPSRKINDSLQLHDQLFNQYITLEMQSNTLRAQLAAQQRAHQAQNAHAAQAHAQAIAQAQAQVQAQSQGQGHRGQSNINGSPQKSPYMNGPSSPQLSEMGMHPNPMHQQYIYQYPTFFDPAQQPNPSGQDSTRTNPSSPSLNSSVLRRSVHRSSNASETASHRSQSQPARAAQQPTFVPSYAPMPQYLDPHFGAYHIPHAGHEIPSTLSAPEQVYAPMPAVTAESAVSSAVSSDQSTPKEYLGYYFPEQPMPRSQAPEYVPEQPQPPPQPRHPLQEYSNLPAIPSYNELAQRRRRVSPDITQPLLNTALRRVSRSPSPLGSHSRSYSTSVAPMPSSAPVPERADPARHLDEMGPVIVNGSYPTQPRETRSHSDTLDAFPSLEPSEMPALGIYSGNHSPEHYGFSPHEQHQHMSYEDMQRYNLSNAMHSGFPGAPRNEVSPVDPHSLARVPSGGSQPFPASGENWKSVETANENGGQSPASASTQPQPPQWQPISYTNSNLKRIDTKNAPRAPPQEIKSATLPLLSPVMETRTPSPTASRHDAHKGINGVKTQPKENQQQNQNRRASHTTGSVVASKEHAKDSGRPGHQKGATQTGDKGGKPNAGSNNPGSNSQQANKKPKRKKAGNKSVEAKGKGEPVPTNAAEEKGG